MLVLDLKTRAIDAVVRAVRLAGAEGFVVFYAGNDREVEAVRAGGDDLYLMARARRADEVPGLTGRDDPRLVLVHGDAEWLTEEIVAAVHASGRRVFANSYGASWHQDLFGGGSSAAEVFSRGIDVAQTNAPADACRARDGFLDRRGK